MVKGSKAVVVFLLSVLALSGVFVLGRGTSAQPGPNLPPGSQADPLISKSFVEEAVRQPQQELAQKVAGLQARVEELSRALAALQGVSSGPSTVVPAPAPQPPAPQAGAAQPARVRVKESVNVRSGPGTQYQRLLTAFPGTEWEVRGQENGWYKVALPGGKEGWLLGELVEAAK